MKVLIVLSSFLVTVLSGHDDIYDFSHHKYGHGKGFGHGYYGFPGEKSFIRQSIF